MNKFIRFAFVVLIGAIAAHAASLDEPPKPDGEQVDLPLQQMLESGDPAQVEKAVQSMRAELDRVVWVRHHSGSVPKDEQLDCHVKYHTLTSLLPAMLSARRWNDVDEFGLKLMLATPGGVRSTELERFQTLRVKATLASGNPQQALAEAKALYNVCSMQNTSQAIDLICDCLFESHADNKDKAVALVQKFRLQQAEGAVAPAGKVPATKVQATKVQAAEVEATKVHSTAPQWVLSDVHVDDAPYRAAIDEITGKRGPSFLIGMGNLLLLSDKPLEAEDYFQRARAVADQQVHMNDATEGVARAIRAEDGSVGRANAWVVSLQSQADASTAPANP